MRPLQGAAPLVLVGGTARFKRCPACKATKPAHDFHTDPSNADGLHSCCRTCKQERKQNNRRATESAAPLQGAVVKRKKPKPSGQPEQTRRLAEGGGGAQVQSQREPPQPCIPPELPLAAGLQLLDILGGDDRDLFLGQPLPPHSPLSSDLCVPLLPRPDKGLLAVQSNGVEGSQGSGDVTERRTRQRGKKGTGGGRKGPPSSEAESAMRAVIMEKFRRSAHTNLQKQKGEVPGNTRRRDTHREPVPLQPGSPTLASAQPRAPQPPPRRVGPPTAARETLRERQLAPAEGRTKQCGCCGKRKGAAGFFQDPFMFDGLAPTCRGCDAVGQDWPHGSVKARAVPAAPHTSRLRTLPAAAVEAAVICKWHR